MELYYLLVSVLLVLVNFFKKVTIESKFEHRMMYVLCLMLLIYPIVTQLTNRRIKKTLFILLIILFGITGFAGISASLFMTVPIQYTIISWGLFLASLAFQNCSIFFHSYLAMKYSSNLTQPDTYKIGLAAVLTGLLTEFAVIYLLENNLYIYSAIGIIGHIFTLLGCLLMRISVNVPKSNVV